MAEPFKKGALPVRRIQDARILLVDDNPDLLALVGTALQNAGS